MKLYHLGKDKEISDISLLNDITDAIYAIASPDIKDYYDIHVNFINNSYIIDCESKNADVPDLKVSTYISKSGNREVLKITPKKLINFPSSLSFNNYSNCMDICNIYIDLMDFISALYDFEYEL